MAWVNYTRTSSGGNISLDIAGGYSNVTRSGNTVTGNLGLRFYYYDQYTQNSVVGKYNGTKYYAQNRTNGSGSYATSKKTIYCKSGQGNGYNTTETFPWSFSATVSGAGGGNISITMATGWKNWAGDTQYNYTFSVPYPALPESTVTLQINKQRADGTYEGWTTWKTITVQNGGSYSETWSETGYQSVTFTGSNVTSSYTNSQYANRTSYQITLNVNKQKADGTYEGATYWKSVSVLYGGSYYETWSATGFGNVVFSNYGITSSFSDTRNANRNVYSVALNINKQKVDGTFESAVNWKTISVLHGASYSQTWSDTGFENVSFSGNNITSSYTNVQDAYRKTYNLSLKGYLDNQDADNIIGYGVCSLSCNDGSSTKTGISGYTNLHRYGTTYTFYDIIPETGFLYKGVWSGTLTGTITEATTVKLHFVHDDFHPREGGAYNLRDYYIQTDGKWDKASRQ